MAIDAFPFPSQNIHSAHLSANPSLDSSSILFSAVFRGLSPPLLSIGGSFPYEGHESVSSTPWCHIFLTFHFHSALPLLLPIFVFFPITTSDVPSMSVGTGPLDLRIKWLLSCHLGTSLLFSFIKYFLKVEKNEEKIEQ